MYRLKTAAEKLLKAIRFLAWKYFSTSQTESIYFYTFHKCASTLFSSYVLQNIKGLYHIDYANIMWTKPIEYNTPLTFKKKKYIYGPIRLSARNESVINLLVHPTTNLEFAKDKIALFFIRDPRDILVSQYYSFGYTHSLNPVKEKTEEILSIREEVQSLTIDEYALKIVDEQIENFNKLIELSSHCKQSTILKYEDMIENFDSFIDELQKVVSIDERVVQDLHAKSRPKKEVDNKSHRRSGNTRSFEKDLKPETTKVLNQKLEKILTHFNFSV
ncbi:MAG: hypothetical protein HKN75_00445 [Bacteroidia bacterium]|nr:hypothetical protein [Bacteroidia bacterium]